jgi:hypothetical protein
LKIYTGITGEIKSINQMRRLNVGAMISTSPKTTNITFRALSEIPYFALDNGAFTAYRQGYPFPEYEFLRCIALCHRKGILLDFIVCPDIVGSRGRESLEFSLYWERRIRCPMLALVVSSPLTPEDIMPHLNRYKAVFVGGGDANWQFSTLPEWVGLAKEHGKLVHVGMVSTVDKLEYAHELGVDSIDSTSFVRNKLWERIESFLSPASENQGKFAW